MKKKVMAIALGISAIVGLSSCEKTYELPKINEKGIIIDYYEFNEKLYKLLDYEVVINRDLVVDSWHYEKKTYDDSYETSYSKGILSYDYFQDILKLEVESEYITKSQEIDRFTEMKQNQQIQPYLDSYRGYDLLEKMYVDLEEAYATDLFSVMMESINDKYDEFLDCAKSYEVDYYQSRNIYTANVTYEFDGFSAFDYEKEYKLDLNFQFQHKGNDILVYYSMHEENDGVIHDVIEIMQMRTTDITLEVINHDEFIKEVA